MDNQERLKEANPLPNYFTKVAQLNRTISQATAERDELIDNAQRIHGLTGSEFRQLYTAWQDKMNQILK